VRNSRIRFLKQSPCCPRKDQPCSAVHERAGVRVGERKVSPLFPTRGTLCSTAPSLPWVAWASLPHLPRYDAPLRLPPCPSRARYLACFRTFVVSLAGSCPGGSLEDHARAFGHPVPIPGTSSRRQVALPRSRVPPMAPCPALRPRWCPAHSPYRAQDCCLPATGNRRLSPPYSLEGILLSTTILFSGLNHAACILAPPGSVRPLTGRHVGSLLTCWLDVSQVGLAPTGQQQPVSWSDLQSHGFGLPLARPASRYRWRRIAADSRPPAIGSARRAPANSPAL